MNVNSSLKASDKLADKAKWQGQNNLGKALLNSHVSILCYNK